MMNLSFASYTVLLSALVAVAQAVGSYMYLSDDYNNDYYFENAGKAFGNAIVGM